MSPYEGLTPNIIEDGWIGYLCPQKRIVLLTGKREIPIKDVNIGSKWEPQGIRNI
ncbi:MAG: hypothetical protein GY845_36950 [Planctomycetes bacterium]|nr:hypothetical protein [Planctomycetota bacterium]